MRILEIAPYMTCNEVPLLSQCKAGFGYMVFDIARSLSRMSSVDSFLYNYRYKEFYGEEIRFLPSSFGLFFINCFKCSSPLLPLQLWWRYKMKFRTFIRIIYLWFLSGYLYNIIENGRYDIIHIHGCSFADEIIMDVCKRANQKFVVTLHGLNSFSDSVTLEPSGKQYERDFLQRVANGEFPITVISSGIKRTIEKTYGVKDIPNLFVVCNAFSFEESMGEANFDIRKKYGLPADALVILYVGNLCRRKNQKQMIDAFPMLPKHIAEKSYVLFLGKRLEDDYSMEKLSEGNEYRNHFIECGNIDKEFMPSFYSQGDAVTLLSISEGFGLSLIEGMHYGLPCLSFDDIDAFDDIYNRDAMIGVETHSNQAVADGLKELLSYNWGKKKIIEASKKFEPEKMASTYLLCFNQITTN